MRKEMNIWQRFRCGIGWHKRYRGIQYDLYTAHKRCYWCHKFVFDASVQTRREQK